MLPTQSTRSTHTASFTGISPTSAATAQAALPPESPDQRIAAEVTRINAGMHVPGTDRLDQVALFESAALLVKSGQRGEAIAMLEKAVAMYPKFLPLRWRLVAYLQQDGKASKAMHVYGIGMNLRPPPKGSDRDMHPQDTWYLRLYRISVILVAEDAELRSLKSLMEEKPYHAAPSAAVHWEHSVLADKAMILFALGQPEEASRTFAMIDPPDDNTITALLYMDRLPEAFDILPRLNSVELERVWNSPFLDKLLHHPRAHELIDLSGVRQLRAGHLQVDVPAQMFVSDVVEELEREPLSPQALHRAAAELQQKGMVRVVMNQVSENWWFYSPELERAEAVLRWGIGKYPDANQKWPLQNRLAEVLLQQGRYGESLSLSRTMDYEGGNATNRFLAKLFMASTRESLQDLDDELMARLESLPVSSPEHKALTAIKATVWWRLTGTNVGLERLIEKMSHQPIAEQMLHHYFASQLRRERDAGASSGS